VDRRLRVVGAVALILALGVPSDTQAREKGTAHITRGHTTDGVKTSALASYEAPPRPSGGSASAHGVPSAPLRPPDSSTGRSSTAPAPVFTRSCAATHTVSGETVSYSGALTQECLLASLAPPADEPERGRQRRRGRPPRPSPEELARIAADRAIALAPKPRLRFAPRAVGLTGLPSYFWLARRPRAITASAGVPRLTVTAQARPVQYVWGFDDGGEKVTRKSGRRWRARRPGNIGHVYQARGRYRATVEVIWEARWRIGGGAWRPLGYFTNSDSRRYRVRQVIAVLVRPR
jgi:hypothetical protein